MWLSPRKPSDYSILLNADDSGATLAHDPPPGAECLRCDSHFFSQIRPLSVRINPQPDPLPLSRRDPRDPPIRDGLSPQSRIQHLVTEAAKFSSWEPELLGDYATSYGPCIPESESHTIPSCDPRPDPKSKTLPRWPSWDSGRLS